MSGWPPFRVTVLTWAVLTLTAWNALRLWTAISWRAQLSEFAPQPGPLYVGLTGGIWAAAGLAVLAVIWLRRRWAGKIVLAAAAAYTVWYWIDRLALQQERSNWPFTAATSLLLLIFVVYSCQSSYFTERGS